MTVRTATNRRLATLGSWEADLRAAVPGWVMARVALVGALVLTRVIELFQVDHGTAWQTIGRWGLLSWDANWYQRIAVHGYAALPQESLRFFPLYPLIGRILGAGTWLGTGIALLLIANAAALTAGALLHRFSLTSGADPATARRIVDCFSFAPPAFVLVMGYTEGIAITLALIFMLALLQDRPALAVAAGAFAGLARPTGIALIVPALVVWFGAERAAQWRLDWRERGVRATVAAAPAVGTATYLLWCQVAMGQWAIPFDVQTTSHLRGRIVDPVSTVVDAFAAFGRLHFSAAGHEVTVVIATVLLLIGVRRWPVAVTAWGATALFIAFTAERLGSLERYVWGSVVPVMTLATLGGPRVKRVLPLVLGAGFVTFATLAFTGAYVP
jgi:hypothetical protein